MLMGVKEVENILNEEKDIKNTEQMNGSYNESDDSNNDSSNESYNESNETTNDQKEQEEVANITSATDELSDITDELSSDKVMSDEELDDFLKTLDATNETVTQEIEQQVGDNQDVSDALKEKDAAMSAMGKRLDSYIRENGKLKVQVAELETFNEDPLKMLIVKARSGDENSKKMIIEAAAEFNKINEIDKGMENAANAARVKGGYAVDGNIDLQPMSTVTII